METADAQTPAESNGNGQIGLSSEEACECEERSALIGSIRARWACIEAEGPGLQGGFALQSGSDESARIVAGLERFSTMYLRALAAVLSETERQERW